jgi:hypothetical protein
MRAEPFRTDGRTLPRFMSIRRLVPPDAPACRAVMTEACERCGCVLVGVEPPAVAVGPTFVSKVHMGCDLGDGDDPREICPGPV